MNTKECDCNPPGVGGGPVEVEMLWQDTTQRVQVESDIQISSGCSESPGPEIGTTC